MDFKGLQYFMTVAQELNFSRAAEKLHMSQPPLSSRIRQMEEDLGVTLFIRGKRHLQLTEAGRLLYRRASQMLELADKARSEMRSFGRELSGRICLAIADGRAPAIAAGWMAGFREEYPLVEFSLWNGSSDDVLDRLHRGLADLALIVAPYDTEHLEGIPVWKEPWTALIPASHPLAQRPGTEIRLSELAEVPLVIPQRKSRQEAVLRWFSGIGREPRVICTLSRFNDAAAGAAAGAGACIYPETQDGPYPGGASKVITEPERIAEYELVWIREQPPVAPASVLTDYVRDLMEEAGEVPESGRLRGVREQTVL